MHHAALLQDEGLARMNGALDAACAPTRGYATVFLSLSGLITQRTCHLEDELAFDEIGLYQGAIITLLRDGQQVSHRDHCTSVPVCNLAGDPIFVLGLCFLSPAMLAGTRANSPLPSVFEGGQEQICLRAAKLSRGGLAPRVLRRLEHYLKEHLPGAVSLASLAAISGLSVSHFAREFKRSLGTAPYQFIQQCRLRLAADVIVKTARPLADIALEMGFADQSHFSRSFTRTFGTTPREFRRNYTHAEPTGAGGHVRVEATIVGTRRPIGGSYPMA